MLYKNGQQVKHGHKVIGKDAKGNVVEGIVVSIAHDGKSGHAILGVAHKDGRLIGDLKSTDFDQVEDAEKEQVVKSKK